MSLPMIFFTEGKEERRGDWFGMRACRGIQTHVTCGVPPNPSLLLSFCEKKTIVNAASPNAHRTPRFELRRVRRCPPGRQSRRRPAEEPARVERRDVDAAVASHFSEAGVPVGAVD